MDAPSSPALGLSWTPIPEIETQECALVTTVPRESESNARVRSAALLFQSALEDEARRREALTQERRTLIERTSEVESELRGIIHRERQLEELILATKELERAPWTPISWEPRTTDAPTSVEDEFIVDETPTCGGARYFSRTISPRIVSTTVSALRRVPDPSLLTVSDVRECAMRSWSVLRELHPDWNLPHRFRFSDEWCEKKVMSRLHEGSNQGCCTVAMPGQTKTRKRDESRINAPPRDEKRSRKPNPKFPEFSVAPRTRDVNHR